MFGKVDIRAFLLRQPGFWVFQVTGWSLFALGMKLYFSEREVFNLKTFYEFYVFYFLGFLVTTGLRVIYKRILKKERSILIFILAAIFFSALAMLLLSVLADLASFPVLDRTQLNEVFETYKNLTLGKFYRDSIFWFVVLLLWSVLYFGIKSWLDLMKTKERSEKAVLLAQQSQLHMLRYQLNPHFLFNSLNSIQALLYDNPECADRMIIKLSEFLRYTLKNQDRLLIPLAEEIKIAGEYLSLEQIRFPDRLRYSVNVTREAAEREVVAFILQPFIENAVKHGMKSSPDFLEITINASCSSRMLVIKIENNGRWIEPAEEGIGIRNVLDRLQNAFPGKYSIDISKTGGSVCVTISIEQ